VAARFDRVVKTTCPINVQLCTDFARLLAFRYLQFGNISWAQFLYLQVLRSSDGEVTDRWGEAKISAELGWGLSLEVRPIGPDERPESSIPAPFEGLSVFAGPKILRYIARSGQDLVAHDIANSHPTQIFSMMPPKLQEKMKMFQYNLFQREAYFAELASELGHASREDCKKLTLATIYGGNPKNLCLQFGFTAVPEILLRLQKEVFMAATYVARRFPDKLELMKKLKKKMPSISLLSYFAASMQRGVVEQAGFPLDVTASFERDCVVTRGPCFTAAELREKTGISWTVEAYPDENEIMAMLCKKFPYLDFGVVSKFPIAKVMQAHRCCLIALEPKIDPYTGNLSWVTPKNTTDFGLVVSAALEPFVLKGGAAS
jgi:hypothetical protein